jgi:hypothetical protein
MKDETYAFIQDVKEKKATARSARNKRTHNGKSGRVKFPSDYMTKKELNAMNGEVKSYRLNEPMTWKEFKAMPDDIKITYVKLLREKFHCFDSAIAEMMGINKVSFSQEIKRLGLGYGTKHGGNRAWQEKEAFYAWVHGVPAAIDEIEKEAEESEEPTPEEPVPEETAPAKPIGIGKLIPVYAGKETIGCSVPKSGSAYYEGNISNVMNSVLMILGNADVRINITWEVKEDA